RRQLASCICHDSKLVLVPARTKSAVPPADICQCWRGGLLIGRRRAYLLPIRIGDRLGESEEVLSNFPRSDEYPIFPVQRQRLADRTIRARRSKRQIKYQLVKPRRRIG